jgi:hypothetical protein
MLVAPPPREIDDPTNRQNGRTNNTATGQAEAPDRRSLLKNRLREYLPQIVPSELIAFRTDRSAAYGGSAAQA